MKVLDLQCGREHLFEGWFASEEDFANQKESGVLICPLCGDSTVNKRLSAPRLNLLSRGTKSASLRDDPAPDEPSPTLQAAWMALGRDVLANTEDVGNQFAQEARKIHYGEVPERGIRGQATLTETESLIDEGIAVQALLLPEVLKQPLH
jgi:hypothetical protein